MTYRQGRVHPQVLALNTKPAAPKHSWWLDPAFQRGDRSPAQLEAEARMQQAQIRTSGERRVLDSRYGKV